MNKQEHLERVTRAQKKVSRRIGAAQAFTDYGKGFAQGLLTEAIVTAKLSGASIEEIREARKAAL